MAKKKITKKMTYNFIARDVVVLNFSRLEDLKGIIIPPEANCEIVNPVPVLYSGDYDKVLGNCYLYRIENRLYSDMYLTSVNVDDKTLARYAKLTPAIAFKPKEIHDNIVLCLEPWYVSLSLNRNADPTITPLNEKVDFIRPGDYVN